MTRVTSQVWSLALSAVYVLMLPVWVLLTVQQWFIAGSRLSPAVVGAALVALVSIGLVFRGITLARQNIEADDRGVRMSGFGGFDVPWDAVAELRRVRVAGATNVLAVMRPGQRIAGDVPFLPASRRSFGVDPERVDALLTLAEAHGVRTAGLTAR